MADMNAKDQRLMSFIKSKAELSKTYDYRSADGFSAYVGDDFPLYSKLPVGVAIPDDTDGRVRGTDEVVRPTYSSYKSRDVFETIEKYMPYIMRPLGQSKHLIEIIPNSPEDQIQARKESRALNFMVLKSEKYYQAFHDFVKNFLIYRNAYLEVYVDKKVVVEMHMDLVMPEVHERMKKDNNINILNTRERSQGIAIEYTERKIVEELVIRCIPNERMFIDNNHDEPGLDKCKFIVHKETVTRSDLRAMGYSDDFVDYGGQTDDAGSQDVDFSPEKLERDTFTGDYTNDEMQYDEENDALTPVDIWKVVALYDYDDDGYAELNRIIMTDWKILDVKIINMVPYVSAAAIMIPNEHKGMSMAETIKPIESVNDNLYRRMFNNIHRAGISRKYINMDAMTHGDTLDALVNSESQVVPINTWGGKITDVIYSDPVQPVSQEIASIIQMMKDTVSARSGVNPDDEIDPATLQRSTQQTFQNASNDSKERPGLLIRNIAEIALRPLFVKVHYLLRRHPELLTIVRNGGMWENIDPSTWPERKKMMATVGMAQLNPVQLQTFLFNFFTIMKELPDALVNKDKIFNLLSDYLHSGGIEDASEYLIDPENEAEQPPPPPPDPQAELISAQTGLVKKQTEAEDKRIELENQRQIFEKENNQEKINLEASKLEADREDKEEKIAIEKDKLVELRRGNDLKELELDYRYEIDKDRVRLDEDKQISQETKIPEEINEIEAEIDKLEAETDKIKEETKHVGEEMETTNE